MVRKILFLVLVVLIFFLLGVDKVEAIDKNICGESDYKTITNFSDFSEESFPWVVYGWAWTENIGWISFNKDSVNGITGGGGAYDYAVNIEQDGSFSGYAWAENIGWIKFDPQGPYPTSPNYSACIDLPTSGQVCDGVGDYKVSGWARACSVFNDPNTCEGILNPNRGGWDGWIKLRNLNYGVWLDVNVDPAEFHNWAWGSDDTKEEAVVGWMSFNCAEGGAGGNVYGWSWTETIGWTSFNNRCLDVNEDGDCNDDEDIPGPEGDIDYAVNIEQDGSFSGYAWAENIGWIKFDPQGPYPTSPNYSACIDLPTSGQVCDGVGDYKVSGWARACSVFNDPNTCEGILNPNRGGWDGWIKLRNLNYGVWLDVNVDPAEFHNWAWGSDDTKEEAVVGWMSFNCAEGGANGENICGGGWGNVWLDVSVSPAQFHGYAWGGNAGPDNNEAGRRAVIGWMSFNCAEGGEGGGNVCADSDYKVMTDFSGESFPTGDVYGWAWAENIGWTNFNGEGSVGGDIVDFVDPNDCLQDEWGKYKCTECDDCVTDPVRQPAIGGADYLYSKPATTDRFGMTTLAGVNSVQTIIIWGYGVSQPPYDVVVDISKDGTNWEGEKSLEWETAITWRSATYNNLNWSQSELDNLQVKLRKTDGSDYETRAHSLYAEVYYKGFGGSPSGEGVFDYGVKIEEDGKFSGYAWSENIGWIKFDPQGFYPTSPNYSVCIDLPGSGQICDGVGDYKVSGWARACAVFADPDTCSGVLNPNRGGWDGWIEFRDKGSGYKVVTTFFDESPRVDSSGKTSADYCIPLAPGIGYVYFEWTYVDDNGDFETRFRFQVDDDSNFGSPEVDRDFRGLLNSSGTTHNQTVLVSVNPGFDKITFGKDYYWRVKVYNNKGESDWFEFEPFNTPVHPFPSPDFEWFPENPVINSKVRFDSTKSKCFGRDFNGGSCEEAGAMFNWTMPGTEDIDYKYVDGTNSNSPNPRVIFLTPTRGGNVRLEITDDAGTCAVTYSLDASLHLPKWKEIPPFGSWLRDYFVSLTNFFF